MIRSAVRRRGIFKCGFQIETNKLKNGDKICVNKLVCN